jgi:hypothetical protein
VGDARLGEYQPWGLMLLLSEISPAIHFHFDYFSTLTPKALGRIEARLIEVLQQAGGLVAFHQLREAVRGQVSDPHAHLDRLLGVILDHHPDICGTNTGEYFLPNHGTQLIIRDIFQAEAKPLHFRDLTAIYNNRMLPSSRKGSGFILRTVNLMPEIQRVDRALYQLTPATA